VRQIDVYGTETIAKGRKVTADHRGEAAIEHRQILPNLRKPFSG